MQPRQILLLISKFSQWIWTKLCMQGPYPQGKLYVGKIWDRVGRGEYAQCNRNSYLLSRADWTELG